MSTPENKQGPSVPSVSNSISNQELEGLETTGQIRLPTFWDTNPEAWFIVAESQFSTMKKLRDDTKVQHIVGNLPQHIVESVLDIIKSPNTVNKYDVLKTALLERHGLREEERMSKLLSDAPDMGDLKPSEYFRRMESVAGTSDLFNQKLIKNVWINKLPKDLAAGIVALKNKEIDEILPIADTIWLYMSKSPAHIASLEHSHQHHQYSTPYNSTQTHRRSTQRSSLPSSSNLETQISNLCSQVQRLTMENRKIRNSLNKVMRSRSNSRQRSNTYSNKSNKYCFYHFKFGAKAKKCEQPCAFKRQSPQPSTSSNNLN